MHTNCPVGLTRRNVVLASAVLMAFSLMAYLFVYNAQPGGAPSWRCWLISGTSSGPVPGHGLLPASHPAAAFGCAWLGGHRLRGAAHLHFADAPGVGGCPRAGVAGPWGLATFGVVVMA
jgi:hypothetical protein